MLPAYFELQVERFEKEEELLDKINNFISLGEVDVFYKDYAYFKISDYPLEEYVSESEKERELIVWSDRRNYFI